MQRRKVGVIGSLVWDEIHGRDPGVSRVSEWGGIGYALSALDATLPADWELVPLVKVGRDLAREADAFLKTLSRRHPSSRFVEVPQPNNRVVLRYQSTERRCERMSGGVPSWRWDELGPLVRDLDAIYLNFISGFEMCLGTATALRHGFGGPIYADLHSLLWGMGQDGLRDPAPLRDAPSWFGCFDFIQVNADEMSQLAADPLALATMILSHGASALVVTLGSRGAVYVTDRANRVLFGDQGLAPKNRGPVRTALIPAPLVESPDPTGCGDVLGASTFAALLGGASIEAALEAGVRTASRSAEFRGATGLNLFLRGLLVTP